MNYSTKTIDFLDINAIISASHALLTQKDNAMQSLQTVIHSLVERGSLDRDKVVTIASRLREGHAPSEVTAQIGYVNMAIGAGDPIEVTIADARGTLSELQVSGSGQSIQAIVVESFPGENYSTHYRDVTAVFRAW